MSWLLSWYWFALAVSHLVRKPLKRAATSWGHEHKGMKALPRLHLDMGLSQSHDYALVSLGTGSDSSPGWLESNQQSLTSKQTKPAGAPQFYLEPYIWSRRLPWRTICSVACYNAGPPLGFMDQVSLVFGSSSQILVMVEAQFRQMSLQFNRLPHRT